MTEGETMSSKAKECLHGMVKAMTRKKKLTDDMYETPLKRCLTTFDLTLLGIGHMIGAGVYVLTGTVVKDLAGPSAILSYLFAGFVALLAALCYSEFGARVPKAGSAYTYTFVAIGELMGFIIGWNIILEHLLGASSVARAWSGAIDSLFNGAIRNGTIEHIGHLGKDSKWISDYPDFIAFAISIIIFIVIASGAKFTMNFNNVFTLINAIVIIFVICAGFYFADLANWTDPKRGGFFPHGFGGTLSGTATCFFAFVGFEGIAVAGEEAKKPEKSIPFGTFLALSIVSLLYVLATISLTLMVPYTEVSPTAAFPMAFATRGAHWIKVIVAFGTLFGLTTSLLGSAFSVTRAIYAMASDGLLFSVLGYVHPRTQTPVVGIAVFGLISAFMSLMFEIETLVEFMSIGTLSAYTIVAAAVIIVRYQSVGDCQFKLKPEEEDLDTAASGVNEESAIIKKSKSHDDFGKLKEKLRHLPILKTVPAGRAALYATYSIIVCIISFCLVLIVGFDYLRDGAWWAILLEILFAAGMVVCYLIMIAHEKNDAFITFQMPFVPVIPCLSMFCNVCLMMTLNHLTWIRLAIWIAIGLLLYFCYGIWHSHERNQPEVYDQMINYTGDAELTTSMQRLEEDIREQQPKRNTEEAYVQDSYGSM
ncbi:cationic amino acid transporter 4-like isoform X1 [Mytilus galloprovincialis]|uniref:cationic amino acid transporter 4-like isoform X1 n=2 Tax=Mytilus galloprovincialis TaxID=29158 RepID=UPI003F7B6323